MVESYQEQAEREMRSVAASETDRPGSRPSRRQIYALAAVLLERLGEEWPNTREKASALLRRLTNEAS
jgi:hypothetical protein